MSKPRLDLELLRVFCTVAETKLLNNAAERLGVSPSAVSQSLKRLEENLGTELFLRDCRPLKPTPAGRKLLREGRPLLEAADALSDDFRTMSLDAVSLRLGLGEVVNGTISPWLVAAVHEEVAELSIHSMLNTPLIELLKNDQLDVCLSSEGLLDEDGWTRVAVHEEEFIGVSHEDAAPVTTLEDFRKLAARSPYICYTTDSYDGRLAEAHLRRLGINPRTRIRTNSSYCLVGLVDQARGWSLLPPTNLWAAGAFAGHVRPWRIPSKSPLVRTTWAVGRPATKQKVEWITALARRMFIEHTLPELGRISSVAAGAARILGGPTPE